MCYDTLLDFFNAFAKVRCLLLLCCEPFARLRMQELASFWFINAPDDQDASDDSDEDVSESDDL